MSVEREDGNIVFQCDSCSDALRTDDSDFTAAWALAHAEGWRIEVILSGTFVKHTCPACAEEQEPFE